MIISIDIETYSSIDLSLTGVTLYAAAPDFDILLMAWAIDNGPVQLFDFHDKNSDKLTLYNFLSRKLLEGCTFSAYNASFEWTCICAWLGDLASEDWRESLLNAFTCTMAQAAYCGLPIGLGATGAALGLPDDKKKYAIGKKLIDIFCKPSKKTLAGERAMPAQEPEKWELFKAYCIQDVEAERAIQQALAMHKMPDREQVLWRHTCRMNARGVAVDVDMVQGAISITAEEDARLKAEGQDLGLDNPNSLPQLKAAVNKALEGIETINVLRKADVQELIEKYPENETLQAILNNRLAGGKSSLAKYPPSWTRSWTAVCTMPYGVAPGRLPGAAPAAEPPELANRPARKLEAGQQASGAVRRREGHALPAHPHGFVPETGHCFLIADFSAIEARVIAWLANEKWVMDVFAGSGKIYEATASQMFGVPIDRINGNPEYALRQKGKIATLALGYAGSSGALIAMGALRMGLDESELPDIVSRWRTANPRIVRLWQDIGDAAIDCVTSCTSKRLGDLIFRAGGIPCVTTRGAQSTSAADPGRREIQPAFAALP